MLRTGQHKSTTKCMAGIMKVKSDEFKTDSVTMDSSDYGKTESFLRFGDPGTSEAWFFFRFDDLSIVKEVKLYLNHCGTSSGGAIGIYVNEKPIEKQYKAAPKYWFEKQKFNIPEDLLEQGENKVSILLHRDTDGPYCLSDAEIHVELEIKVPKKRKVTFK